jgi:uncharacterized membrane protein YbhN (UPF0104 family)
VNKRIVLNLLKYALAVALLTWVVRSNWSPRNDKAAAALGASSVALSAAPGGYGPLLAASAAVPDRAQSHGLGYVWQRHVVQGLPLHSGFLLAALLIYTTALLITLLRWYILVRAQDLPLRLRDALRYGMIGVFFNAFLPGSVGGDIIKAAVLARGQSRRTVAVATVIMDRVIALWALVWFVALLGSAFWALGLLEGRARATSTTIVAGAVIAVAVSLTAWLLLGLLPEQRAERFAGRLARLPRVGGSAAELWRAVWIYRCRQGSVLAVMCLTWVGHVGFVLAFYCGVRGVWSEELGPLPTLPQHFLLVPIGMVMQALVPTPGGAGAGEWSFGALCLLFSAAEANGILGSLVLRVTTWVLGLAGYVLYLWTPPGLPATEDTAEATPELAEAALVSGTPSFAAATASQPMVS